MSDPKPCGICGHGILDRPSAHRVSGRIVMVHKSCGEEMAEAERLERKAQARAERDERRLAILRGEIL